MNELPSRRWITKRFAEHLAALRAHAAGERRAVRRGARGDRASTCARRIAPPPPRPR